MSNLQKAGCPLVQLCSVATFLKYILLGCLFAVRCAVQVHLSHNVPGVNFVREVQVMRTVALGPGTAKGTGKMTPPKKTDQTISRFSCELCLHWSPYCIQGLGLLAAAVVAVCHS